MSSHASSTKSEVNNVIDFLPCKYKNFELLDRMGSGGMAEVFRAVTLDDVKRLVIIKRPHEHLIEDAEFLEMFRDEIKISAKLKHPNIAYVNSYDPNGKYIELEYIKGFTLNEIIKKCKILDVKIPLQLILKIVLEVAWGLKYLHEFKDDLQQEDLNLIHRDISPQNIMISTEGQIKIIDFGVAKIANHINQTQADVIKGKYNYMSPEQCSPNKKLDGRSDLFSLGIVLFELLTLKKIFQSKSLEHYLTELRNFKAIEPKEIDSSLPEEVSRITYKLIQPEPEFRFQNASEFINAVQSYLNSLNKKSDLTSYEEKVELSDWLKVVFKDEIKLQELSLQESLKRSQAKKVKDDDTLVLEVDGSIKNSTDRNVQSSNDFKFNRETIFKNKRKLLVFTILLFSSFLLFIVQKKYYKPPLSDVVMTYVGVKGTKIDISKFENKDDEYLIFISNTQNVWNGKSIKHKKAYINFKEKFITNYKGSEFVTIVGYESKGGMEYYLYLPEVESEKLQYNFELSKNADIYEIWNSQEDL